MDLFEKCRSIFLNTSNWRNSLWQSKYLNDGLPSLHFLHPFDARKIKHSNRPSRSGRATKLGTGTGDQAGRRDCGRSQPLRAAGKLQPQQPLPYRHRTRGNAQSAVKTFECLPEWPLRVIVSQIAGRGSNLDSDLNSAA